VQELADYVTQDIVVTTTTDWLSSQMILETDVDGDIYQHPYGSWYPPDSELIKLYPALEFDTYVSDGDGGTPNAGTPVDLYGGECSMVFDDQLLQISWSTMDDDQTGDLHLARVTLADDATGKWSFMVTASPAEGPCVYAEGDIVDGVIELEQTAAPGTPDLHLDTDSGISGTDDITYYDNSSGTNALKFDVSSTIDGATVRIYYDDTVIGTGTGNGGTLTITADGSHDIPDGNRNITATQKEPGKNESVKSTALSVTIDTDGGEGRAVPPYLPPAYDTGVSSSDGITKETVLMFCFDWQSYFRFYRDTTQISGDWEDANETEGTYTTDTQPEGTYDYSWVKVDLAGNESTHCPALEVTIDTTAPTVTVDTKSTSDTTPELTGDVDDSDADVDITVDGNEYDATNNGTTWTLPDNTISPALEPDTYDVTAEATDVAGNVGSDSTTNELTITE